MADAPKTKKKRSLAFRTLKWTGIVFFVLLGLIILLPILFKDKLIQLAKQEVNKNLNAKVDWGDFSLTMFSSFPDFRFTIENVKVIGINEFAKDTLASIPELQLDLDLMSVISGDQYRVNSISLKNPRIHAHVLRNGKANWDITKPDSTAKPGAPAEPSKFKLKLKNLEIENAHIVYDDRSMDFRAVLDSMNHELSGSFTESIYNIDSKTSTGGMTIEYGGISWLKKARTDIKAKLDLDMNAWKFTLKENEFKINDLTLGIDGWLAMPKDIDMDLKYKAKQSDFKNFLSLLPAVYTKDFANVKTTGKLAFDGYVKGKYSEKTMPGFGINLNIADGSFQYPSLPKSVNNINVDAKIDDPSGEPDKMVIDVKKFGMTMAGNPINATLHVTTPVSDANLSGDVKGKIDLASVRDVVPVDKGDQINGLITADVAFAGRMSQIDAGQYDQFKASGNMMVNNMKYQAKDMPYGVLINTMKMTFTPQYVSMDELNALLGKNDVQASGRIDNMLQYFFKDQLLKGTFTMHSNLMDLNQFMTPTTAATTPAPATTPAASSSMAVIQVPGNIDVTLNSTITKLIYDDINMDNVSGAVLVHDHVADLSKLTMSTMGGQMTINGSYDTKDELKPKINFDLDVKEFDIKQTFSTFNTVQKLAPIGKYATGKFSTSLKFAGDLDDKMMPVMPSVNGKGSLSTKQVVIQSFEPLKKLDDELKLNKFKNITLSDLSPIGFSISNGRVFVDKFTFKNGKTTGDMQGSTGLDETIDYTMSVLVPRSEFGSAANTVINNLTAQATAKLGKPVTVGENVDLKVLFGGTITKPTIKTSLKEAAGDLKNTVTQTVTTIVNNAIDSAKIKAKAAAQKAFNDAKAQAEQVRDAAKKAADAAYQSSQSAADQVEKSYKNPLEKAAKKLAADKMRETAKNTHDAAIKKADDTYNQKITEAQARLDAAGN